MIWVEFNSPNYWAAIPHQTKRGTSTAAAPRPRLSRFLVSAGIDTREAAGFSREREGGRRSLESPNRATCAPTCLAKESGTAQGLLGIVVPGLDDARQPGPRSFLRMRDCELAQEVRSLCQARDGR